jgi:hypothetical protein
MIRHHRNPPSFPHLSRFFPRNVCLTKPTKTLTKAYLFPSDESIISPSPSSIQDPIDIYKLDVVGSRQIRVSCCLSVGG